MPNSIAGTYIIRNYRDPDADQISNIDFITMLAYRYNGDYEPRNIFCAVDSEGTILGVGHIVPDPAWLAIEAGGKSDDFVYKLKLDIFLNEEISVPESLPHDLYDHLLSRAKDLRARHRGKCVRISHTIPAVDKKEMDFYISKGFDTHRTHLVMKRDLTKEIPDFPLPEGLIVKRWGMETQAEEEQYLAAEAKGDLFGVSWSLNYLRWTKNGEEWNTFTVFNGNDVAGSVMTWGLGEGRSATENIFVLPEWRRKGIAKAVITEALKFLKAKGKTEATLGVFGDNGKAISLYESLGYRMLAVMLEFGLDI
ncbi:GNAT family N-acetyltransferase [Bacillus salacetis]|uniref:GNAT family N-acetyltransferase n=1 Tax=Bacillus salacetis TaxID=2315464 RepID=A0A3A1R5M1_9BACI|nr:GNAT family N-acetyltransferase [Bacillus salacetis]RIW34643.1 GNAT family N-acetyltransferase [Bacillus salacetis]